MPTFEEHVQRAGFAASLSVLSRWRKRSVRMRTSVGVVASGRSRIGGCPDLPSGFEWPSVGGRPMAFLAQLRLEEVLPHDELRLLPRSGWLCFFHETADRFGSSLADAGGWAVIHVDGNASQLARRELPDGIDGYQHYTECGLTILSRETLPDPLSPAGSSLAKQIGAGVEDYSALRSALAEEGRSPRESWEPAGMHRLLGWPDQIQEGDLRTDCHLVTNELPYEVRGGRSSAELAEIERASADWELLLQLDSDDQVGFEFVDVGRVYFLIRRQDLAAARFDRVWHLVQFH